MVDLTLWAGRVTTGLAPEVWAFLRADDAELLPYDLQATLLHAGRLHEAGILDDAELAEVAEKLAAIETIDDTDEDVHSSIERQLGDVGRKIHAGRSRNDQVAAAFRLYVGDACNEAETEIRAFARTILDTSGEAVTYQPERLSMERSSTAFTARDRIGQLAMQLNDITDTRQALGAYANHPLGQLGASPLALPDAE